MPTLFCVKNAGPGDSNLIITNNNISNQDNRSNPKEERIMSMARLKNLTYIYINSFVEKSFLCTFMIISYVELNIQYVSVFIVYKY